MTEKLSSNRRKGAGAPLLVSEAADSCGGQVYGPDGDFPSEVVVDSRDVRNGSVFVAMKGDRTDGHLFLKQAFENGAQVIVAEKESWFHSGIELPSGRCLILTEGSTREALLRMAHQHLINVAPSEVIAITGSVGKTTTREITASLLRDRYRIHVAQKSYNTDIGCALTILGMPLGTEILLLEMGCSHPGEIAEMVSWFPPTRGIITEVGPSHLEGLGNLAGVLRAKLEILRSKQLRSLSFNCDNNALAKELANALSNTIPMTGVGWSPNANLRILSVEKKKLFGQNPVFRAFLERGKERASVIYSLFGLHHARNIALALSVVLAIDKGSLTDFRLSLESPQGRGRLLQLPGGGIVVDDSYNANPLSVKAALKNFGSFTQGESSWIILGGMKELGAQSASEHARIVLDTLAFSNRIFIGREWNNVISSPDRGLWFARDAEAAIEILSSELTSGCSLLIKGSRTYRLERIVNWLVRNCES